MGKLNPNNAFMTGKMKIKGNMAKATKFTPDLFPPPTPENIAKYTSAKLWKIKKEIFQNINFLIYIIFIHN